MSVQVTQTGISTAALYCDTEDVAFGPVFDTAYEAGDFLDWLHGQGLDARDLDNNGDLVAYKDLWEKQHGDQSDTEMFGAGSA